MSWLTRTKQVGIGLGDVSSVLPFVVALLDGLDTFLHSLLSLGFLFLQNLGYLEAKANLHLLG